MVGSHAKVATKGTAASALAPAARSAFSTRRESSSCCRRPANRYREVKSESDRAHEAAVPDTPDWRRMLAALANAETRAAFARVTLLERTRSGSEYALAAGDGA
jgi:hypothetical protein